jgi:hypothetical protein
VDADAHFNAHLGHADQSRNRSVKAKSCLRNHPAELSATGRYLRLVTFRCAPFGVRVDSGTSIRSFRPATDAKVL